MTQEELINVFKYIVKKCDMLINNGNYEADAYTQDTVEDIAELCNHILDGDYGKLAEAEEVDLEKEARHYLLHEHSSPLNEIMHQADLNAEIQYHKDIENAYKAGFESGLKTQKGE